MGEPPKAPGTGDLGLRYAAAAFQVDQFATTRWNTPDVLLTASVDEVVSSSVRLAPDESGVLVTVTVWLYADAVVPAPLSVSFIWP